MTALPVNRRKFTPEEYLVIERAAETRSEFVDGEIYAMAGATEAHITINDNLTIAVGVRLRGNPCQGMSQNMKVPAGTGRLYAYPDFLIGCGQKRYRDRDRDVLLNPLVIFEVLSPSTELYDRKTKFNLYKQIESLREFVLIAQDSPVVEHWLRQDDESWRQIVVSGTDAALTLEAVSVTVPLAELYDRIEFAAGLEME